MACKICGCPEVRWLRVGTVAEQFKCSRKLVRRLLKAGQIEGVLFGGEWRIDHQSLDDYVLKDSLRSGAPGGGQCS
jgi:excisionase family DNA binding protein